MTAQRTKESKALIEERAGNGRTYVQHVMTNTSIDKVAITNTYATKL